MKHKKLISVFLIGLLLSVSINAQQNNKPLTNADIIRMTKEGVEEDIIIRAIRATPVNFDVSADGLIQLKRGKVKKNIIALMQNVVSMRAARVSAPDDNNAPRRETLRRRTAPIDSDTASASTPAPEEPKGLSWSEMPVVKGKVLRKPDTIVFGEKYPNSFYLPEELATFRTEKKYKKLIMKIGVQDNEEARGSKHISIKNEDRVLYEFDARPNRRPKTIEIDISDSDLVGFFNYDINGEPSEFIRYLNVTFIPIDK